MKGFSTQAIHGGQSSREAQGALRTPIYDSVAFEHESASSLQMTFEGRKPAHAYSRITNPTVQELEQKVKTLTGGLAVLALSSGMAAISNTIFTIAESGTNIVTTRNLFGNSLSLFEKSFAPWGLNVKFVDMSDPYQLEQAIDNQTRAVFLESITNPQLEVADFQLISTITNDKRVPLILDNTLTTPYLFNSKKAGIDIEILSSTKYISGGATSVGGLIIDNGTFDWMNSPKLSSQAQKMGKMAFIALLRQEIFRNIGSCMSPHNAYLQSLGLETIALRIDKSCANSTTIAQYLETHSKVTSVNYPGLTSSKYHRNAKQFFNNKYGGILTFDLADQSTCFALIDNVKLIRRATNINDNKSLILHPYSTIFAEYSDQEKELMGVRPTMIRLSVGIEDIIDLLDDLSTALEDL